MFSKPLTLKHSIGLSLLSTLFSMGYVLHDRLEHLQTSLLPHSIPTKIAIQPTSSQQEEQVKEMMLGWWPPQ